MNNQDLQNIVDNQETGLTIVPLRTGSSKTYSAMDFISKYSSKRVIYITNRNNNLPVEELKQAFFRNNISDFQKKVLVVKSNFNSIIDNLPGVEIPQAFQSNIYWNLLKQIESYENNKNNDMGKIAKNIINVGFENEGGLEKNFRKEIFKALRLTALKEIKNDNNNSTLQKRMLNLIRYDSRFHWIAKVYPTIFIKDYPILMLNTSKFLTSYITISGESKRFLRERTLIDGSLIIIDEFDQTKRVILDKIENQSINDVEDIFKEFQGFQQVFNVEISNEIEDISTRKLIDYLKKLKSEYKLIQKKYHINSNWYLRQQNTAHELMFFDGKLTSFLNNDVSQRLYSTYKSKSVEMRILSEDAHVEDNINILSAIMNINKFYRKLFYYFAKLAKNYFNTQNQIRSRLDIKLDYSSALSTVMEFFKLTNKQKKIIENGVFFSTKSVSDKLFKYRTSSFYDHGLKLTFLENDINHNLSTLFNTYSIRETPEKIMLYLSSKAHVVGLSATAGVKSNLSNYDLDYLKSFLGRNYINAVDQRLISSTTLKELGDQDKSYISKKVSINVQSAKPIINYLDEKNYKKLGGLIEILKIIMKSANSSEELIRISNELQMRTDSDEYELIRYLEVIEAMGIFFENNEVESFLCLTSRLAKENDSDFDLNLLFNIFDYFKQEYEIDSSIVNLRGEGFQENKQKIISELESGKKVFVLSTYQTMGDGQNLQYIPPYPQKLKCIGKGSNKNDKRYTKKDFDGLYLGDITYVTENLFGNDFKVKNLIHYLVQVEYLSNSGELGIDEKSQFIVEGLKRMGGQKANPKYNLMNKKSSHRKVLTTVIQAVGRLNRTFNKNEIHILISSKLLKKLPIDDLSKMSNDNLLTREMNEIYRTVETDSIEYRNLYYKEWSDNAKRKNEKCKLYVNRLLNDFGQTETEDAENLYDELRDFVLQNPTIDKNISEFYSEFYFFSKDQRYWMKGESEYYFNKNNIRNNLIEISEQSSSLPILVKNPIVREYFKNHNITMSFGKSEKIMCSYLFNYIYKAIIGEKAGIAILEKKFGIEIKRFRKQNMFEKFDYEIMDNQILIDFKNWHNFDKNFNIEIKRISEKLNQVNGKKVLIVNLIDDGNYKPYDTNDNRIVIIQGLMNEKGILIDENIRKIAQEIVKFS
ncbi:hypothetical protein [Companilactobacillus zhachilii]|uniref:hypothetical protein n=1 Tax=Companilactobacillus zhachilii TaxID=2304606 RepID=UPI00403441E9